MRTVAVINQKGGTGKTTSAVGLAGVWAAAGKRTLLVDLDPQGHCGLGFAIPEDRIEADVSDLLAGDDSPAQAWERVLWPVRRHLALAPSLPRLAGLEAQAGPLAAARDREHRLAQRLEVIGDRFDRCIIDCPPHLGVLAFNAIVAADAILVPVETSFFALRGALRQHATIDAMARRTGRSVATCVVATMHDAGAPPAEQAIDVLRNRFGSGLAPVSIPRDRAVGEAATLGLPVTEHAPASGASRGIVALAGWIERCLCWAPPSTESRSAASAFTLDAMEERPGARSAEIAARIGAVRRRAEPICALSGRRVAEADETATGSRTAIG
jgi:chromosome partitioning protein